MAPKKSKSANKNVDEKILFHVSSENPRDMGETTINLGKMWAKKTKL